MTLTQLLTECVRRTKTSGDDIATTDFQVNLNEGIKIIASKRDWPELFREATLSLTAADGDISYALSSDVKKVYQMRIISPDSYIKGLDFWKNFYYWEYEPTKANKGTSTPGAWYFTAPTTNTNGSSTFNVSFDEKPQQSYTVKYSYKVKTPTISSLSSVPFFDEDYHSILIDYALWKYAEREADPSLNPTYFFESWQNGLEQLLEARVQPQREMTPIPGP